MGIIPIERIGFKKGGARAVMISSKGRYALRVMLDMAEQHGEGYIRLGDIAARQDISRKYLESIMTALCKSNLVESALGKTGRYKLVRSPEEYKVGEILEAAEGEIAPVSCLTKDGNKCGGNCYCYTMAFWKGLEDHINAYVNSYTLRDLLNEKDSTLKCGSLPEGGVVKIRT